MIGGTSPWRTVEQAAASCGYVTSGSISGLSRAPRQWSRGDHADRVSQPRSREGSARRDPREQPR